MRSVGDKSGLTGMAWLAAVSLAALSLATGLALSPAWASTSGNNEPDPHVWDRWNWPALNTEELAQQDTTTTPGTQPANHATSDTACSHGSSHSRTACPRDRCADTPCRRH